MNIRRIVGACFPLLLGVTGCFPTFQSARIDPGFHLDAGFTALADQRKGSDATGPDYVPYLNPSWGIRHRVEIGVPVGFYFEDGFKRDVLNNDHVSRMVLPYVKVGLLDPKSQNHLALIAQTAVIPVPLNLGIRYGRDFGTWEPQLGLTWIHSSGPAGDDPVVTRYQQEHQSLIVASVGATLPHPRLGVEVGVLRNSYLEDANRITLYDLFIGMRVGLATRR